jgi:hypothetical protein
MRAAEWKLNYRSSRDGSSKDESSSNGSCTKEAAGMEATKMRAAEIGFGTDETWMRVKDERSAAGLAFRDVKVWNGKLQRGKLVSKDWVKKALISTV